MNTISNLHNIFLKHPIVSTDSRNCPQGCLFFALKGDNFNANAFAKSALDNGAAFVVIDEAEYAVNEQFILVDDVLKTLQQLAKFHRNYLKTKIIGITGTNGKTTTKELIASVLSQKFNVLYTQGNLNNHIGVPLTLLQLMPEHEIAVVEMGANHPGEIKELAEITCPDFGIITNVGKAHIEGFGSFEGVMKTKAELYDYIQSSGDKVFINSENEYLLQMANTSGVETSKFISYSFKNFENQNFARAEVVSCSPFLELHCTTNKADFDVKSNLIGVYNAENMLAAVTIASYFDVPQILIKQGLESYIPQNNRSQLTVTSKNKLVVDAYNANPTSMMAAIMNFVQMDVPTKMLILGDMLELGETTHDEHQRIVDVLEKYQFKNVWLVGSCFKETKNNFKVFTNVEDVIEELKQKIFSDYYILIKGSRGIKLEKVIPYL